MVARDLQKPSCPTHLLKQSYVEQVFQDNIQAAFEYLQG